MFVVVLISRIIYNQSLFGDDYNYYLHFPDQFESIIDFLSFRYKNWTSRLSVEFVMFAFIKHRYLFAVLDSLIYVLIVYSFNNQLRFNNQGKFNLPVGKRDFNAKMKMKLSLFIDRLKSNKIQLTNYDFRKYPVDNIDSNTFVYVDPPYLITCATYNEKNGWTEQDEKDLLQYLNNLNKKGIRFALSNVLYSKGKENKLLQDWIAEQKYKVIYLDYSYSNSNYQTKDKKSKSQEVLIINY